MEIFAKTDLIAYINKNIQLLEFSNKKTLERTNNQNAVRIQQNNKKIQSLKNQLNSINKN